MQFVYSLTQLFTFKWVLTPGWLLLPWLRPRTLRLGALYPGVFILLNVWFCVCEITCVSGLRLAYTCAELMNIGFACQIDITPDFFSIYYFVFFLYFGSHGDGGAHGRCSSEHSTPGSYIHQCRVDEHRICVSNRHYTGFSAASQHTARHIQTTVLCLDCCRAWEATQTA